jgi:hypothetical protein
MYKIPEKSPVFGTISPVSLDFSKGNVYFVGIHSPVLWFGNVTQMKNNTSDRILVIPQDPLVTILFVKADAYKGGILYIRPCNGFGVRRIYVDAWRTK